MTLAKPINFTHWIEDNEHLLKPPVSNKTMAVGDDFNVQVTGGPDGEPQRIDIHEVELQVRDIVADLPPVFSAFNNDEQARVCRQCGKLHPGNG